MSATKDGNPAAPMHFLRRRLGDVRRATLLRRAFQGMAAADDAIPDAASLRLAREGWGNTGCSASVQLCRRLCELAIDDRGPILECGSGLTTLLLAHLSARTGRPVTTFEHEPAWYSRVRRWLKRLRLSAPLLLQRPLVSHGTFDWYDLSEDDLPAGITLVLCDGPPGWSRGGRFGLLPITYDKLADRCTILLDDFGRERERTIAVDWTKLYPGLTVARTTGTYAELVLEKPQDGLDHPPDPDPTR